MIIAQEKFISYEAFGKSSILDQIQSTSEGCEKTGRSKFYPLKNKSISFVLTFQKGRKIVLVSTGGLAS